jgi:hypothetical protein
MPRSRRRARAGARDRRQLPPAADRRPQRQVKAKAFRPAIATPLQAAEQAIRAKKYDEALARSATPKRYPTARRRKPRDRADARHRCVRRGRHSDGDALVRDRHQLRKTTPADQARMIQVVAQLYFQGKDYPKAATWAARSLKENGPNADMLWLMVRAHTCGRLRERGARASRHGRGEAKTSTPPVQERLQMLATCSSKLGDDAGNVCAGQVPRVLPEQGAVGRRNPSRRNEAGILRSASPRRAALAARDGHVRSAPAYVRDDAARDAGGAAGGSEEVSDEGFASGVLGTGAGCRPAEETARCRGQGRGRR